MSNNLVVRLEKAVDKVLEQNRLLSQKCEQLEAEKRAWQEEKESLLADVEHALKRFENLDLEDM